MVLCRVSVSRTDDPVDDLGRPSRRVERCAVIVRAVEYLVAEVALCRRIVAHRLLGPSKVKPRLVLGRGCRDGLLGGPKRLARSTLGERGGRCNGRRACRPTTRRHPGV